MFNCVNFSYIHLRVEKANDRGMKTNSCKTKEHLKKKKNVNRSPASGFDSCPRIRESNWFGLSSHVFRTQGFSGFL